MPSIYYETGGEEVFQIDEVSQRLLVYVYLHGRVEFEEGAHSHGGMKPKDVANVVGATDDHAVRSRIESQLGENAAGLINASKGTQKTLTEGVDTIIVSFRLTEAGEEFVEKHRANLSMPVEIAELAKRVAAFQIEDLIVDDLVHKVDELEDRIEELEK